MRGGLFLGPLDGSRRDVDAMNSETALDRPKRPVACAAAKFEQGAGFREVRRGEDLSEQIKVLRQGYGSFPAGLAGGAMFLIRGVVLKIINRMHFHFLPSSAS